MTAEKKKTTVEVLVSMGLVGALFVSIAWLNTTKADNSRVDKQDAVIEKVCDEQKAQKELYHGLDKKMDIVISILQEDRLQK